MLKNYIKIAFRVMLRQKFFTAVSIFGISFTVMIFSIAWGSMYLVFGNVAPAVNRDRLIYYSGFSSTQANGDRQYTPGGPAFLNDVKKLKGVENLSMYIDARLTSFTHDKKISLDMAFTDEKIFEIYKYEFIEGKPYNAADAATGQSIAVITESVKKYFFGSQSAVGKYLETTPRLKVVGVVKDHATFYKYDIGPESARVLVPLMRYHPTSRELPTFSAIILSRSKIQIPMVKKDMLDLIQRSYNPSKGTVSIGVEDIYEKMDYNGLMTFITALIFFIMVIPALNIMGLNINRISERSSEIGIRKAFGASSAALATQFIIENLLIACLGGILGVILTFAASGAFIDMFYYREDILPDGNFMINWSIIGYAMAGTLFLGLLSGVLPAWRMSQLHSVNALKGGMV